MNSKNISIYIHIPFCKSKCKYCDFTSFSNSENLFNSYLKALISEIRAFENPKDYLVNTIFIGGGTPSLLPPSYTEKILSELYSIFMVSPNAEITTEANPESITSEKTKVYLSLGINRISVGLQAWQNELLSYLGRIHTKEKFLSSFDILKSTGFKNINIDLMFALPNQTLSQWEETLNNVIELSPTHISAYSLIIEDGTPFFLTEKQISDELDRIMYHNGIKILQQANYNQYEISNFAFEGYECKHNLTYWNRGDYVGFGLSAHSMINNIRFANTNNMNDYLSGNNRNYTEKLAPRDCYAEFMFLGLRKTKGIAPDDFFNAFNVSIFDIYNEEISDNIKKGLLHWNNDRLCLTSFGIDVSNQVFLEFL